MISVRVYATDDKTKKGEYWDTRINCDLAGAKKYYMGKQFNLGETFDPSKDRMVTAYRVIQLKDDGTVIL